MTGLGSDESLWPVVEVLARAERIEEIEQLLRGHPSLVTADFLAQLDRRVDEIERTGRGDWWGLTRARVLLAGYRDGELKGALFRCWTRDLLPLGPDDVRSRATEHPELLAEQADVLLRHWASEDHAAGHEERTAQIELRRELLRKLAADRMLPLIEESGQQEREFQRSGNLVALDHARRKPHRLPSSREPAAPTAIPHGRCLAGHR